MARKKLLVPRPAGTAMVSVWVVPLVPGAGTRLLFTNTPCEANREGDRSDDTFDHLNSYAVAVNRRVSDHLVPALVRVGVVLGWTLIGVS